MWNPSCRHLYPISNLFAVIISKLLQFHVPRMIKSGSCRGLWTFYFLEGPRPLWVRRALPLLSKNKEEKKGNKYGEKKGEVEFKKIDVEGAYRLARGHYKVKDFFNSQCSIEIYKSLIAPLPEFLAQETGINRRSRIFIKVEECEFLLHGPG